MTEQYALAGSAAEFLRGRVNDLPSVAIVLGSGGGPVAAGRRGKRAEPEGGGAQLAGLQSGR